MMRFCEKPEAMHKIHVIRLICFFWEYKTVKDGYDYSNVVNSVVFWAAGPTHKDRAANKATCPTPYGNQE